MGLDTSHDCWHGSYGRFSNWRNIIAATIGIPLDYMEGFSGERPGMEWELVLGDDPIVHLLHHSDCEGILESKYCSAIATRLEEILSEVEVGDQHWYASRVEPAGTWVDLDAYQLKEFTQWTEWFIKGLRLAASKGEDVDFH